MEEIYNIYKIKTYNTKRENYSKVSGNINKICEKLEKDRSYHLIYTKDDNLIFFLDIDHIYDKTIFNDIIDYLCDYFNIEFDERLDQIFYSESKKDNNELSYHISIPKFYTSCANMKNIISHFKSVYKNISEYIDLSIYKSYNLFRLPTQTNEQKQNQHIIIKGEYINFVVNYIPFGSIEYINSNLYNYNKDKILSEILDNKKIEIQEIKIKPDIIKIPDIQYQLFHNLAQYRYDNYEEWIKLGCLLYSLYDINGLLLYIELSKKSDKFTCEIDIINKYNTFNVKKYSIKTLYYLAKRDNPNFYNKIIPKIIINEKNRNIININKRYLLNLNSKLDNNDDILTNNINIFFTNANIKCLSLKSPYDSGKTQMLKAIIQKNEPQKVLFISYRISLSIDLMNNFKELGFHTYLDKDYSKNRLIIQIESLTKLLNNDFIDEYTNFVKQYDLIILDECESILAQFNSPTFKNESKVTYNYLTELCKTSKKCIFLDGDICDRTYSFINTINENQINIINNAKFNQKIYNIIDCRNYFINDIYNKLNNDKKIVIVCQSRRESENFYKLITIKFPNKKTSVFTSLTDDKDKKCDVNTAWLLDVLIYSPVYEAGVSFDIIHYDYMYCILCNGSSSQRSFMQQTSRVRKLKYNTIMILNDKMFKLNNINNFINYDDITEHIRTLNIYPMEIQYIVKNNIKLQIKTFDNYTNNYIYNEIETHNKQAYYFLTKLKNIIENKGHIFNYIENTEITEIMHEKGTNELYNEIMLCEDITQNEYDIIEIQKKNNECSKINKIKALRFYYLYKLGLKNLNLDILKTFYNKTNLLTNFLSIIDIENYKQNNEAQNIKQYNKLILIKQLLLDFNINNIFDTNYNISESEFTNYFDNCINTNKLFKNESQIFYNIPKFKNENSSTRKKLGYINSILLQYCIKLSCVNKMTRYGYNLQILNNIDEIIKSKMLFYNYDFYDQNKIFNCNKCDLMELY